jgi:hypothetical protein
VLLGDLEEGKSRPLTGEERALLDPRH